MIRQFFSTLNFGNRTKDPEETPIIDELVRQGVDQKELERFLIKYGPVLLKGIAFEASEMYRTKAFSQIENKSEAFSEGQQCFQSFLTRFFYEAEHYQTKKTTDDDVWEKELESNIE